MSSELIECLHCGITFAGMELFRFHEAQCRRSHPRRTHAEPAFPFSDEEQRKAAPRSEANRMRVRSS